ncbi:MAG TPA: MoxR family ATPase [Pseudobdellovibrionaceae bacterium]|nr:MoxR family ATPase [Pseudobdellovibrionaceae bacterium]
MSFLKLKSEKLKHSEVIQILEENLNKILVGKNLQVRLSLSALFARGHLLIEDMPGVGKTTLVQALAKLIQFEFKRIQFTNDMLPADILGVHIFNETQKKFEFHPGPIFSEMLLADEINRATPKTQSALLQAMEERKVSLDSHVYPLPEVFFMVGTQNPQEQEGAYPLPESQMDRFLLRISIGYPDRASEREILLGEDRSTLLENLKPVITVGQVREIQEQVKTIKISEAVLNFIQDLATALRARPGVGISPRGVKALLRVSQSWALLEDRSYVTPEDVKVVAPYVLRHRLILSSEVMGNADEVFKEALTSIQA